MCAEERPSGDTARRQVACEPTREASGETRLTDT